MNLTLVRGLPGSGKSTIATQLLADSPTAYHVETDMFFTDYNGNYEWNRENITAAHKWCLEQARSGLKNNLDVFVSNTFTTVHELRPYFELAKEFEILPTVILCQNDWGSSHDVPLGTILNMKKRFTYDLSSLLQEYTR
jgi:predicted kinase